MKLVKRSVQIYVLLFFLSEIVNIQIEKFASIAFDLLNLHGINSILDVIDAVCVVYSIAERCVKRYRYLTQAVDFGTVDIIPALRMGFRYFDQICSSYGLCYFRFLISY